MEIGFKTLIPSRYQIRSIKGFQGEKTSFVKTFTYHLSLNISIIRISTPATNCSEGQSLQRVTLQIFKGSN